MLALTGTWGTWKHPPIAISPHIKNTQLYTTLDVTSMYSQMGKFGLEEPCSQMGWFGSQTVHTGQNYI